MNNNNNKFCLGICELFHPRLHGFSSNSTQNIESHYIVHMEINLVDFWNKSYEDCLEDLLEYYHHNFHHYRRESIIYHPIIRNYNHIFDNINYLKLNIIQITELPGHEHVACVKTIWLKLLQRKWKRIYKYRKNKIQKLKNLYILRKREITGVI